MGKAILLSSSSSVTQALYRIAKRIFIHYIIPVLKKWWLLEIGGGEVCIIAIKGDNFNHFRSWVQNEMILGGDVSLCLPW